MNQTEMGELMGVPQTTYSSYENDRRDIPLQLYQRLCQLGLNMDWFLTGLSNGTGRRLVALAKEHGEDPQSLAEKTGKRLEVLRAVFDGIIEPGSEIIEAVLSSLGHGDADLNYVLRNAAKDQREKLADASIKENEHHSNDESLISLARQVGRLEAMLEQLQLERNRLESEIRRLSADNEHLRAQLKEVSLSASPSPAQAASDVADAGKLRDSVHTDRGVTIAGG